MSRLVDDNYRQVIAAKKEEKKLNGCSILSRVNWYNKGAVLTTTTKF
jgi:hypothetical protein